MLLSPFYLLAVFLASGLTETRPLPEEQSVSLSLRGALGRALEHSPSLAAFAWELRAAEARLLQAGLRPNPEIAFEFEDIGAGSEDAQGTILVSQRIEINGKRAARKRLAQSEQDLSRWDYERVRADVLEQTATAFIETLGAQERQNLAVDLVRLSEAVAKTIGLRVSAGRVSPLEADRASILLSLAQLDVEDAADVLWAARRRLAANWGETAPDFEVVSGRFDTLQPLPSYESLRAKAAETPDLARWDAEIQRSHAGLALAQSERVADPTLRFGFWNMGVASRARKSGLVLGFSIPLPLFDRNQGRIREAEHLVRRTNEERRAAEVAHQTDLFGAYQAAQVAYRRAIQLKESILPDAESLSERIREGYSHGKFGYLEVLDAERALFELRTQYLDALIQYHGAVLRMQRLTMTGFFHLENEEDKGLSE